MDEAQFLSPRVLAMGLLEEFLARAELAAGTGGQAKADALAPNGSAAPLGSPVGPRRLGAWHASKDEIGLLQEI